MKIVLAFEHIQRLKGAHSQIVTELGRRLVHRGHDVIVLCDDVNDPTLYPELEFIARRVFIRGDSHRRLILRRWAAKQLQHIDHDVSLSFYPAIDADIVVPLFGWIWTRLHREYQFHHRHIWAAGLRVWPPTYDRHIAETLSRRSTRVQKVVALSEPMAATLTQSYPTLRSKLTMIPGASPIEPMGDPEEIAHWRREIRHMLGFDDNDIIFIWASKKSMWHGRKYLIDSFRELHQKGHTNTKLIMVGEGLWSSHRRLKSNGIAEHVRLVGRTGSIEKLIAASDVSLFPAIHSILGRFVWESLAFGKPVITTTNTGASDRVNSIDGTGCPGCVIKPYSQKQLTDAMIEMCDPPSRADATKSAQDIASTLGFDLFVDRMEQLLLDTI